MADFAATIAAGLRGGGAAIDLGRGVHDGAVAPEAVVKVPLAMMNRHGLVAGATGTGKTKTLQAWPSSSRPPASPCSSPTSRATSRACRARRGRRPGREARRRARAPLRPDGLPGRVPVARRHRPGRAGARDRVGLRAAAARQGARRQRDAGAEPRARLPLRRREGPAAARPRRPARAADVPGLRRGQGRARGHRRPVDATVGVLLRALVGLETGGGNEFFGEPQLDIADLLRTTPDGRGIISCLELPAVQDKPEALLDRADVAGAELFETLPEAGDLDKPKLVFFFDEAHLLFNDATKAFLDSVDADRAADPLQGRRRLLRHPDAEGHPGRRAGQLGNRVQHALRAFTPGRREGAEGDRLDVPEVRLLRPRGAAARDGHRRGGGDDARRERRARRRSCTRACWPPRRGWRRPTTSRARRRPRRCGPSTARAWTARARASCSRRAWTSRRPSGAARSAARAEAQGGGRGGRRRRGRRSATS